MPTPIEWYEVAKRFQQQRWNDERIARERAAEVKEHTLAFIVDPMELCSDCRNKVMRP